MLIGTFEIAVALFSLILLTIIGRFDSGLLLSLSLLILYGAMGTGLLAIQEWARRANVIFHATAIPTIIVYTFLFLEDVTIRLAMIQLIMAVSIVFALTRPAIRHKFQTVVPKQKTKP